MTETPGHMIKNIEFSHAQNLTELVEYKDGQVVSRTLAAHTGINITLFAFDQGEEISAHTAPGDAMVQILDGQAKITIGDGELTAKAGQVVVMPANVPHALYAATRFKMLLTVVKLPLGVAG